MKKISRLFLAFSIFLIQYTFGQHSATNDSLVYVVDGFIISSKLLKKNVLDLIDKEDIESIEIDKSGTPMVKIRTKKPEKYREFFLEFVEEENKKDSVVYVEKINPEFYLNRGVEKFDEGNYAAALADYDSAVFLDLKDANVFTNRGLAKEKLNNLEGAKRDYEQAITKDSKYAKAYSCLATLHFKQNQFKEAIKFYTTVIVLEPENGFAYYNRGLAQQKLKMLNECCSDLKKASDLGVAIAEKARKAYCK